MKIALVHDDFIQYGGAERLFGEIAKIFPGATVYTSLVDYEKLPQSINKNRIKTSFMQKIPLKQSFYKALLFLYPFAFETMNFDESDLVISSTTRFAKSIITKPGTYHICYVNSLPRFLYEEDKTTDYLPAAFATLLKRYLNWLRRWDTASASRVDQYIANSKNVKNKIKKYYRRESVVVHPFADTDFFTPAGRKSTANYYLVVSRLVKWKKIDIAIKTAKELKINLKIVGSGPDLKRLNKQANKNIDFLQNATKKELRSLYQNAKALIVTQDEDFGIAAVEAQSCATPVIGYKKGGTCEIVIDRKTGVLFPEQTPQSLKDAILISSRLKYSKSEIRKNALRFTKKNFEKNFKEAVKIYDKPA